MTAATDEILSLIVPPAGERPGQERAHADRLRELRRNAAVEFGQARGRRLARRSFGLSVLARRAISGPWHGMETLHVDHPYFYRTSDRRAAAIVAHLYGVPDDLAEWAATVSLLANLPAETSWWWPGQTTIVLLEPL